MNQSFFKYWLSTSFLLLTPWSNQFQQIRKVFQNTKYIVIKHNVKRFPSDKINITKTAVFLSSLSNFNLQFLYQLMHMVYLSKTVCGIFHFQFCLIFIEIYIFVQQNMFVLFDFKNVIIPFKIKVIEKIYIVLLPDL